MKLYTLWKPIYRILSIFYKTSPACERAGSQTGGWTVIDFTMLLLLVAILAPVSLQAQTCSSEQLALVQAALPNCAPLEEQSDEACLTLKECGAATGVPALICYNCMQVLLFDGIAGECLAPRYRTYCLIN